MFRLSLCPPPHRSFSDFSGKSNDIQRNVKQNIVKKVFFGRETKYFEAKVNVFFF
jgi:hypothetical protein